MREVKVFSEAADMAVTFRKCGDRGQAFCNPDSHFSQDSEFELRE